MAGSLLGARVLIVGAGPIGLAVTLFARAGGARQITVAEPGDARRALAERLGAVGVASADASSGADVIFECVGVPGVLAQCMRLAPLHGRIIVVGVCRVEDRVMPRVAIRKELLLQFVLGYTRDEFAIVLDMLASGQIDAAPLISGVIGLDAVPETFEALRRPGAHAKVLIDPTA
jgi:(R,R)-butanediol dehydrogenase/meso-butanediol dehydrogenase/diacetyl reductase